MCNWSFLKAQEAGGGGRKNIWRHNDWKIPKFDENCKPTDQAAPAAMRLSDALNGNSPSFWVLETLLSIKKYFSIQINDDRYSYKIYLSKKFILQRQKVF